MAKNFNENSIMRGTGGDTWVNGQMIATVQSMQAKVTGDFEEINVCGDTSTYRIFNGYSGEGTITYLKRNSEVIGMIAKAYQSGVMPDIGITTAQRTPDNRHTERVMYADVTIDAFDLAKFEKKAITQVEIPFHFGNFYVLETIA